MGDYWFARYVETLAQVDTAKSLRTRNAYMELANHYRAMHRICARPLAGAELKIAA